MRKHQHKSRRSQQRWKLWKDQKEEVQELKGITVAIQEGIDRHYKTFHKDYGFVANPSIHPMENTVHILGKCNTRLYFEEIDNRRSHNMCTMQQPRHDYNNLIILGFKFCLTHNAPPALLNLSLQRFTHKICLREWSIKNPTCDTHLGPSQSDWYEPKIYIQLDWDPPPCMLGSRKEPARYDGGR